LNRRLGKIRSQSGCFADEEHDFPLPGVKPRFLGWSPQWRQRVSGYPTSGNDRLIDVIKSYNIQNIQKGTLLFQEAVFAYSLYILTNKHYNEG
jgi:hypothetical protein